MPGPTPGRVPRITTIKWNNYLAITSARIKTETAIPTGLVYDVDLSALVLPGAGDEPRLISWARDHSRNHNFVLIEADRTLELGAPISRVSNCSWFIGFMGNYAAHVEFHLGPCWMDALLRLSDILYHTVMVDNREIIISDMFPVEEVSAA